MSRKPCVFTQSLQKVMDNLNLKGSTFFLYTLYINNINVMLYFQIQISHNLLSSILWLSYFVPWVENLVFFT